MKELQNNMESQITYIVSAKASKGYASSAALWSKLMLIGITSNNNWNDGLLITEVLTKDLGQVKEALSYKFEIIDTTTDYSQTTEIINNYWTMRQNTKIKPVEVEITLSTAANVPGITGQGSTTVTHYVEQVIPVQEQIVQPQGRMSTHKNSISKSAKAKNSKINE